jgi:drug/metabolite transporter (DMT)-like permease
LAHSSSTLTGQSVLIGTLSSACWGISTVITKGVLETVPPITLLLIQLLCSNAFLWAIVKAQRVAIPPIPQALRVGLPGLLQPGLSFIAGIIGLSLTTASVEALIWSMESMMIMGLAWLILGERIKFSLIAIACVGVLGVVLVSFAGSVSMSTTAGTTALWGNLLILIGVFCAALYTVLIRRQVTTFSPLILVTLNQSVGLMGVFGIWIVEQVGFSSGIENLSLQNWGLAAVSGLMLHALPFWLFTVLLRQVPAGVAGLFLVLIPLFTISGAGLFLGETLSPVQWMGAALILVTMASVSVLYKE